MSHELLGPTFISKARPPAIRSIYKFKGFDSFERCDGIEHNEKVEKIVFLSVVLAQKATSLKQSCCTSLRLKHQSLDETSEIE